MRRVNLMHWLCLNVGVNGDIPHLSALESPSPGALTMEEPPLLEIIFRLIRWRRRRCGKHRCVWKDNYVWVFAGGMEGRIHGRGGRRGKWERLNKGGKQCWNDGMEGKVKADWKIKCHVRGVWPRKYTSIWRKTKKCCINLTHGREESLTAKFEWSKKENHHKYKTRLQKCENQTLVFVLECFKHVIWMRWNRACSLVKCQTSTTTSIICFIPPVVERKIPRGFHSPFHAPTRGISRKLAGTLIGSLASPPCVMLSTSRWSFRGKSTVIQPATHTTWDIWAHTFCLLYTHNVLTSNILR